MAFYVAAYLFQCFAWGVGCYVAVRNRRKHGMWGFGVWSLANLLLAIGACFGNFNVFQAAGVTLTSVVSFTLVTGYIRLLEKKDLN